MAGKPCGKPEIQTTAMTVLKFQHWVLRRCEIGSLRNKVKKKPFLFAFSACWACGMDASCLALIRGLGDRLFMSTYFILRNLNQTS